MMGLSRLNLNDNNRRGSRRDNGDITSSDDELPDNSAKNTTRRRRRRFGKKSSSGSGDKQTPDSPRKSSSKSKKKGTSYVDPNDEDNDPYDSDPGESYREHCMRIKGLDSKSCLRVPGFLQKNSSNNKSNNNNNNNSSSRNNVREDDTTQTSRASASSPMPEMDDVLTMPPGSLANLQQNEEGLVRYSLRTSVGDGSQKQPTGPSVMERRELKPNGVSINVSHWSDTGCRPYMEDRYAIENLGSVQVEVSPVVKGLPSDDGVELTHVTRRQRRLKMPLTWLGCFDGHGGEKASQYCADWLSSYVKSSEYFPHDLGQAMKNSFLAADSDFVNSGYPDGTTACTVSLVGARRIVCANAGDSRAIVVRKDGTVVRLSRDHKPGIPDETRRISELGGRVIYWGRWRVEGLLAVSRSVGDASLKPYITADPEICEYDIGKDDWFLVLSSDGVWDVIDNEEAAHVVIATSCVMKDGAMVIDPDRFKW
eukprot:CAMPEP_0195295202 /NCGR_PEP_ID=MMETSP0707-20130614/16825_1 /TAXON_ID=33640 /ORGANISM="Asterionellopsis glacialis, Strain CCMP134" /LENGTH=480 /DNA_ID=CAMNT_0040356365 /DNA_START=247 /DNA_END=1686 /DNA_ORIENTATION=+